MLRSVARRVVWVVRGLAFFGGAVVGLALVMGLTVGAASVAFGANGDNFILGKNNVASALTKLTSSHDGSALQIQNNSTGSNDTALNLNVQGGEAPMRVNSATKVTNLNADKLDGKDSLAFLSSRTYQTPAVVVNVSHNQTEQTDVACDEGDQVIGGGYFGISPDEQVEVNGPVTPDEEIEWRVQVRYTGPGVLAQHFVTALCADTSSPHQ